MNSHVWHYTNAFVLSVVVGKLMGGGLGMTLVDPTHRYAGSIRHRTPRPSLWLRQATPADGTARVHTRLILQHTEAKVPP